jgi:hypothetical protein
MYLCNLDVSAYLSTCFFSVYEFKIVILNHSAILFLVPILVLFLRFHLDISRLTSIFKNRLGY